MLGTRIRKVRVVLFARAIKSGLGDRLLGDDTYRISASSYLKNAYLISYLDHLIDMLELTHSIYSQ